MKVEVYVPIVRKVYEFEDGLSEKELEQEIENKISFCYRILDGKEEDKTRCVR